MTRREMVITATGIVAGLLIGVSTASFGSDLGATAMDLQTFVKLLRTQGRRVQHPAATPSQLKARTPSATAPSTQALPATTRPNPTQSPCDTVREAFTKLKIVNTNQRRYGVVVSAMKQIELEYCGSNDPMVYLHKR